MAAVFPHIDIDLSHLTESEQDQIRDVVKRDLLVREQLLERIALVSSSLSQSSSSSHTLCSAC